MRNILLFILWISTVFVVNCVPKSFVDFQPDLASMFDMEQDPEADRTKRCEDGCDDGGAKPAVQPKGGHDPRFPDKEKNSVGGGPIGGKPTVQPRGGYDPRFPDKEKNLLGGGPIGGKPAIQSRGGYDPRFPDKEKEAVGGFPRGDHGGSGTTCQCICTGRSQT